ncbi:hypothetical protein PENTCL1PPCAC_29401, partial [Pristionchus entomophagus]
NAAPVQCDFPSIGKTLDKFYLKLKQSSNQPPETGECILNTANVAHVTTTGVNPNTGVKLNHLRAYFNLTMAVVGIRDAHAQFPSPYAYQFFPGDFTDADDPNDAL